MKRVILCSLLACGVFVTCDVFGDGCDMRGGVCQFVNPGGSSEREKCKADAVRKVDTLSGTGCRCVPAGYKYKDENTSCTPTGAPGDSGVCRNLGEKENYTVYEWSKGDESCEKEADTMCIANSFAGSFPRSRNVTSCVAKYCSDGYLLYTTTKESRKDRREIIGAVLSSERENMVGKTVASQGLCRSRKALESACSQSCVCKDNEECKLNEVTITQYGHNVQSFVGEEMCVCVPKNGVVPDDGNGGNQNTNPVDPGVAPCTPSDCYLELNMSVICNNNTNSLNTTERYYLCQEDVDSFGKCENIKDKVHACTDADCIKKWLRNLDEFDKLIARVCGSSVSPVFVPDNSVAIAAAKQTISAFFSSAESNKSVWKDAEGNFNAARLASDLTAGVVLGTVGGVVSGVVIKKKQVEKGFDALHCTIGGQTVADWGDTFNVGLR